MMGSSVGRVLRNQDDGRASGLFLLSPPHLEAIFYSCYFPHSHTAVVRKQVRLFSRRQFDGTMPTR